MSRRRNQYRRQGAASYSANRRLPLTHESVRWSYQAWRDRSPVVLPGYGAEPHNSVRRVRSNLYSEIHNPLPPAKRLSRPFREWQRVLRRVSASPSLGFCLRRKSRREVLFALQKVGFSGATRGRYRRTANSLISCER